MKRAGILVLSLFLPTVAMAQPCTTDARRVVNELYRHMLERQADAGGAHWAQQLESGRMTVRDVVRSIATSPEYVQRFVYAESGENTPYERSVARLYRHILGRQPDPDGQRMFARMVEQSGPEAAIDRILGSREYNQQFGDWAVPGSGGIRYCQPNNVARNQTPIGTGQAGTDQMLRFRNMDSNADGTISRAEWRASNQVMPAFNRLDVNNDNQLTRSEFRGRATAEDEFQTAPTAGESVTVDARERWTNTGMRVQAGELIMFDVTGTIRMSGEPNDTATARGARSGRQAADAPFSNQLAGALIGRIDGGQPFFIGNRRSVRVPSGGQLFLGVNDDYLQDNSGAFEVMVTVQ
jgi:hypothetical protein